MKKLKYILISILALFAVFLLINGIYCTNTVKVNHYSIKSNKQSPKLHFVFLSDLHSKEFGKNNSTLISKIKAQSPDFIAVGGDMMIRYSNDYSVMKNLLSQLAEIAPVYCVLGNHERDTADKTVFKSEINSTGALLLDNTDIEFEKDGQKVLIGGLTDYPYYEFEDPDYDTPDRYFWDEFNKKSENQYSILLHHQPEYIANKAEDSNIDLILCGHTHGGLIQIPFFGGVIAPNQGLFPKYDKGEFDFGDTKMIISAGLGSAYPVLRINNCAEICAVDVQ